MYTTKGAFTCKSKFIVHAYVQTNIADNKMNQSRMIARKSYELLIPKHTHFVYSMYGFIDSDHAVVKAHCWSL